MPPRLQIEIEKIKKQILSLGAMVEEQLNRAIKAVETKNLDIAKGVIESDRRVDEIEVEIEEECLKILALHQPVAVDLRFISAVIKINNDLERIGDEAVNIAERVIYLGTRAPLNVSFDYSEMSVKTIKMVKNSLDALVNLDLELALRLRIDDNAIDALDRGFFQKVSNSLPDNPENAGSLIQLFLISRHLERIADHATNIAEDVIYLIEGVIHRHRREYK
ncbi:MAG: phosphate signaling complex protein PhoU [Deltaproteobacteria bacterium]|nr:phosphate signaling complex protein PhoU [Deltaproteobacteria bacterium]